MPVEFPGDLASMFDTAEFGVAALWRAGDAGPGVAVSVVPRVLGAALEFGESRIRADRRVFLARLSELPNAAPGDTLEIAAVRWRVADAAPDSTGALLTLDCAKVP
jgi:hypothetical protein